MEKINKKALSRKLMAFSLIEMAIVLIIIGIIISAVMGGGDIIKSADTKQFYQTFARKWSTVIDTYYDRMGHELNDANKDGYFDGGDVNTTVIEDAGINIDKIVGTGREDKTEYFIEGEYSGYQLVKVNLGSYILNDTPYNFLILKNIPTDIAVTVDRYVDGSSDGTDGNCINLSETLPDNGTSITPSNYNIETNNVTNIGIIVEH